MKAESEGLFVGPTKAIPPNRSRPDGGQGPDGTLAAPSRSTQVIPAGPRVPSLPPRDHEDTSTISIVTEVRLGSNLTAPVWIFRRDTEGRRAPALESWNGADEGAPDLLFPAGMERFFEEAAEGRIPLQAVPTDPDILERRGLRHKIRLRVRGVGAGFKPAPCGVPVMW